jgi:Flp pilus assembly protein TadD
MHNHAVEQFLDQARHLHTAGRFEEAEERYRQLLAHDPNHPAAIYHLGIVAHQTGRNELALRLLRQAVALNPNWPEALANLGNVLRETGHISEATEVCQRSIALRPEYAGAYNNLGFALYEQHRFDEAATALRRAIALNPSFAQAHLNLGNALREMDQVDEAIGHLRQAVGLAQNFANAHSDLGITLARYGNLADAIAALRRAIALDSNHPVAHFNLGMTLLMRGEFHEGWKEHEWRWKCRGFPSKTPDFKQPQWDGQPLDGRTIVLHTEQGFGDAIQFIRYMPLVCQRGRNVIVQCKPELQRLFQMSAARSQVVTRGDLLPPFDLHCPLISLPLAFGTTLQSIPPAVPYLTIDERLLSQWSTRVPSHDKGLKVGLAWAGNPLFSHDRTRSLHLRQLEPLANTSGVTFFSLQKGPSAEQAKDPPARMPLVDLGHDLHDFADTAAAMSLMDLIITTDTSVAHLAGALARPTWVMLQFAPDWRWMLDREDSPWYPTMRLFRQKARGDWDEVICRIAVELKRAAAGHQSIRPRKA